MRIACALLALLPVPALAQDLVPPGPPNPNVQLVDYVADRPVTLRATPGYQLMIELAPDEKVENVAVGDSGAWQVIANKRGDRLFVKAVQPDVSTNMLVVTDARLYAFDLLPLPDSLGMAYSVRFRYPAPDKAPPPDAAVPEDQLGRYKLRGADSLRPSGIHDDGVHTYIEWPETQTLPAIYTVDHRGKETLANGMMRDGRMVIDSVQSRLVFRIDGKRATATRLAQDER